MDERIVISGNFASLGIADAVWGKSEPKVPESYEGFYPKLDGYEAAERELRAFAAKNRAGRVRAM